MHFIQHLLLCGIYISISALDMEAYIAVLTLKLLSVQCPCSQAVFSTETNLEWQHGMQSVPATSI